MLVEVTAKKGFRIRGTWIRKGSKFKIEKDFAERFEQSGDVRLCPSCRGEGTVATLFDGSIKCAAC